MYLKIGWAVRRVVFTGLCVGLVVGCGTKGDDSDETDTSLDGTGGSTDALTDEVEDDRSNQDGSGGTNDGSGGNVGRGASNGESTGGAPSDPILSWWSDDDEPNVDRTPVTQVDLLFVIDNSVSMSDKQELLRDAVAPMLRRLTHPFCVDENGENPEPNSGTCPSGKSPEFQPVQDVHLGVISSSLGGYGAPSCLRDEANDQSPSGFWDHDDRAHLMPSVRPFLPQDEEFLAWNGGTVQQAETLASAFSDQISAAGEWGCGFEAPLEAWYRFLVDPSPPENVSLVNQQSTPSGIDETVLAQREAFLRPGGVVGIVMLTDEDDCSLLAGGSYYNNAGFGYLLAETGPTFNMRVATSVCEEDPNNSCCFSCLQAGNPPTGCESFAAECDGTTYAPEDDRAQLRCHDVKRRFGIDLMYPLNRYSEALTHYQIVDARDGEVKDNPLLRGAGIHAGTSRAQSRVFLTGIVGVPWQDLATPESLSSETELEYLSAAELRENNIPTPDGTANRWDLILGEPGIPESSKLCDEGHPLCGMEPVPPLDPFMIPSMNPRQTGLTNPLTGHAIVAPSSNDPQATINGHEHNNEVISTGLGGPARDDLQYACTFELTTPRTQCQLGQGSCDCGDEPSRNRSICQAPSGGPAVTTQYYGKAYPAPRILRVLRDFGTNSVVGSICPKNPTGDPTDPNFGYNPITRALGTQMAGVIATSM